MTLNINQTKTLKTIVTQGAVDATSFDGRTIRSLVAKSLITQNKKGLVKASAKAKKVLN